jgi:hypothetical protein
MQGTPGAVGPHKILRFGPLTGSHLLLMSLAVSTAVAILFPRLAFLPILSLTVSALIGNQLRTVPIGAWIQLGSVTLAAVGLGFLAALSALWAPTGSEALAKGALLMVLTLGLAVVVQSLDRWSDIEARTCVHALVAAVLLTGLFVTSETVTVRPIELFFRNWFAPENLTDTKNMRVVNGVIVWIDDAEANRRTTVFMLLVVPTLLLASSFYQGSTKRLLMAVMASMATMTFIFTSHQSSQLALIAAAVCAIVANFVSLRAARTALMIAWAAATLLAVPIASQLYEHGVQNTKALFSTAQQRIIIWGYTAQQVHKRPILGVGAGATPVIHSARPAEEREMRPGMIYPAVTGWHSHSYYLQMWYELGAVGAVGFAALGLLLLRATSRLPEVVQPFALAQFALAASMIATSYGLWQSWLHGAIAASIAGIALASSRQYRVSCSD